MFAQVQQLSEVLRQTVLPEQMARKNAEEELERLGSQVGYGVLVLQVVASEELSLEIRVAAAINFKNHIKFHWSPGEKSDKRPLTNDEKDQIKNHIVDLMLKSPNLVRAQISEALTIVSGHDFPDKWPGLLPQLSQKLLETDIRTLSGVLITGNSVMKRFRNQAMTDAISNELIKAQDAFVKPLLQVMDVLFRGVDTHAHNLENLKLCMESIRLCCRIFYSLNALGLTELVEDNLEQWMTYFLKALEYENQILAERDPEKESSLDALKAAVCENINLFIALNEEEFEGYLEKFVMSVWKQLVKVSSNSGQGNLAMSAIQFLTSVAKSTHNTLFAQENTLQQICEKVIVPNLKLSEEDEELFETNPMDYIQRDTEGNDSGTRRRAAADLVKALAETFNTEVTNLFTGYVATLLNEHLANPSANWRAKDCAVYMSVALTVKGRTIAQGATTINQNVQLLPFFTNHIFPEIQAADGVNHLPILKADALKFVHTFRLQVPKAVQLTMFPSMIALLGSEHFVVHSYAASTIERLLALKENRVPRFTPDDLAPFLQSLLEKLFATFSIPESSENQYAMQCIMRVIQFVGDRIRPVTSVCLQALAQKLLEVCKNPMQPVFSHYLFESVAALIRYACTDNPQMVDQVQDTLFPAFDIVLQQDVQEFHPYVFQIFTQLIELRPKPLPGVYMQIFPPMLNPVIWERHGNVPALARLIQAYLGKSAAQIVEGNHLEAVLGVFQRLLSSKALDQHSFQVLEGVYANCEASALERYEKDIWTLLCQRMQTSSTSKYIRGMLAFMGGCICQRGPTYIAEVLDRIQPDVFMMLLDKIWLPHLSWVEEKNKQKLCAVGLTKVLCEYPPMIAEGREALWTKLMDALVRVLEGNAEIEAPSDLMNDDGIIETTGYTAAFSRLVNATIPEPEPLPEIPNARDYLAKSLFELASRQPGRLANVQTRLEPETKAKLKQFSVVAKVTCVI
ncbi:hypothetical protein BSKO_13068 [Bryopsis sp. KO-2023]|nr:hypothetical protein BSKO_13068 [Bryopsis sp. KO-2023]